MCSKTETPLEVRLSPLPVRWVLFLNGFVLPDTASRRSHRCSLFSVKKRLFSYVSFDVRSSVRVAHSQETTVSECVHENWCCAKADFACCLCLPVAIFALQAVSSCRFASNPIMSGGLYGGFDADAEAAPELKKEERRVKLFAYDSVASQLFEPYQESVLDDLSLKDVWDGAAKGNKKALYHSHLCADLGSDPWHVGAGVSQTAGILKLAIKNWQSQDMQRLVKEELRDKVNAEVAKLVPILDKLDLGKGSQQNRDTGSYRSAKKARIFAPVTQAPTEEELVEATQALHRWLSAKQSPFRSLLFILSGRGTYYAAHAAEVVARAAVSQKPLSSEDMVKAVRARVSKPAESSAPAAGSDGTGLFS